MLKSKLERYVVKRALICFGILTILDLIFINQRWMVLLGLVIGGTFGLLKFGSMVSTFSNLILQSTGKGIRGRSIFWYVMNLGIILILFIVAGKLSLWLFAGLAAGILLVPMIMFVFGILRGLGVTHNDFE